MCVAISLCEDRATLGVSVNITMRTVNKIVCGADAGLVALQVNKVGRQLIHKDTTKKIK